MTTQEFIIKVKELGYEIQEYVKGTENELQVYTESAIIAVIPKEALRLSEVLVNEKANHNLYDFIVRYVSTPLEDRVDRKYHWIAVFKGYKSHSTYFNYDPEWDGWFFGGPEDETEYIKNEYTEEEFAAIEEKYEIKGMFVKEEIEWAFGRPIKEEKND